jgi:hypothetical protein
MKTPTYKEGDSVMWYGEMASVEGCWPNRNAAPEYFLRLHGGGSATVPECELEPIELDNDAY